MVRTRFYGGFGVLVLALWNYAPPVGDTASYTVGKPKGEMRHFEVDLSSLPAGAAARVSAGRDARQCRGRVRPHGRPAFPSREQIAQLRAAGRMAAPEQVALHGGKLGLDIPPQGLVVVEVH